MKKCSIIDCNNSTDLDNDKCDECLDADSRLKKIWAEKSKEIIIDQDDLKNTF